MYSCTRARHLVHRLVGSNNRLQPPSNLKFGTDAFSRLTELQLNGTLMSWQAIMDVIALVPRLQRLESGYNCLQNLSSVLQDNSQSVLTTLNFDSNQLSNWVETCQALVPFPKCLYHLYLSPFIDHIPGLFVSSFLPIRSAPFLFQLGASSH